MEEDVRARDVGDVVLCRLMPLHALQGHTGTVTAVLVRAKDELAKVELELGLEYEVTGVQQGDVLEAWGFRRYWHPTQALIQAQHGHSVPLPPAVAGLYLHVRDSMPSSPWAFAAALATQLGAGVLPQSALLHLKFGLLLSLASQGVGSSPVGVVAVGADTWAARALMDHSSILAARCVPASDCLGGSVTCDASGLVWQEAGALSLASQGVCLLGDWAKHRRGAALQAAVASLETGVVTLDSRAHRGAMPATSYPLRACVWTYWGDISGGARDQLQLRTLIDVFGMPFLSDESDPLENERMTSLLVEAATSGHDASNAIPSEAVRELLRIVGARDVELSQSASDLIKSYFVASRRERPNCLPVGAIKTITWLAEAHARLSLRRDVLPADVAMVVFLYQEAIEALFGASHASAYGKLTWDQEEPVFSYVHRQMVHFTDWLDNYIL